MIIRFVWLVCLFWCVTRYCKIAANNIAYQCWVLVYLDMILVLYKSLANISNFIQPYLFLCIQLNGFMYCYILQIIQHDCHLFARN